ncbi:hypothetical protein WR25_17027 [Diploscapter pachys]|uniref:Uncharacterized protein n=1 Tax=Diploscapter pachys TaxID=2018661 RepID=A0A2A2KEI7_9BILA|nr:hypothetical protein WR25_17027 [Diploscapter pachys]
MSVLNMAILDQDSEVVNDNEYMSFELKNSKIRTQCFNLLEVVDDVLFHIDALRAVTSICFRDEQRMQLHCDADPLGYSGWLDLKNVRSSSNSI